MIKLVDFDGFKGVSQMIQHEGKNDFKNRTFDQWRWSASLILDPSEEAGKTLRIMKINTEE